MFFKEDWQYCLNFTHSNIKYLKVKRNKHKIFIKFFTSTKIKTRINLFYISLIDILPPHGNLKLNIGDPPFRVNITIMETIKIGLLCIGWYMVIGFFILLIFELVISILKKSIVTRDKVNANFPAGIPANLRYLFFFLWPYILYFVCINLPKQLKEKNELDIDKTPSDFQSRLQKMAEENSAKKEDVKKSGFQSKLEKMAKEKDEG